MLFMKFKDALEIAKDCGLETVGEAIMNISMHAMSIFAYDSMQAEYDELIKEALECGAKRDDKVEDWLSKLT